MHQLFDSLGLCIPITILEHEQLSINEPPAEGVQMISARRCDIRAVYAYTSYEDPGVALHRALTEYLWPGIGRPACPKVLAPKLLTVFDKMFVTHEREHDAGATELKVRS
jgi:hypothetical protein